MARYTPEGLERIRKANEERFLREAKVKFCDCFDYSLVAYKGQKIKITIICQAHGPFEQTPDKHLQSETGCPKCGVELRSTNRRGAGREGFFDIFKTKFGDKLELLSDYVKANAPIICRCKVHGIEFESTPDRLRQWTDGCPQCAREATTNAGIMSQEEFIRRVVEKFGNQFDLSNVVYSGIFNKVKVGCPIHGDFSVSPVSLLQSTHGCPKCGALYAGTAANRIKSIRREPPNHGLQQLP